jgi:hypothetical protein
MIYDVLFTCFGVVFAFAVLHFGKEFLRQIMTDFLTLCQLFRRLLCYLSDNEHHGIENATHNTLAKNKKPR